MTARFFSLDDEFMPLVGDGFNSDDAEMSPPPRVHPDATWPSINMFNTPFSSQFPHPEDLSFLTLGEPGPSGSREGNVPGSHYPPVDLFPQSEYEPTAQNHITMPTASAVVLHKYHRLPGREEEILDAFLEVSEVSKPGRKTFQCLWSGCASAPFTGKCQAHIHVCKHLGFKKLFGCDACPMQFATRGVAKRHCESQQTSFSCSICHTTIKRKDYWRKHERICANKN